MSERHGRAAELSAGSGDGIRATLPELVALRGRSTELVAPRRRSADRASGPTVSAFRGRGMEYAESRPYAPGDDARYIDWRVTARTGRAHSKVFQAERDRVTMVIIDRSPAMYFGTRVRLKSAQAARLGAALAWAAFAEGDRLSACAGMSLVPPARGRRGVLHALDAMARWSQGPEADGGLGAALQAAARVLHPGSHVLLLADARSITVELERPLRQLASHGDVAVGVLCDALELDAPPRGHYVACDDGQRLELALEDADDRSQWRTHFARLREDALMRLRRTGARAATIAAHDDCIAALRSVLQRRVARGRAA